MKTEVRYIPHLKSWHRDDAEMICISPSSRGALKCEVYCVIGIPTALRVRSRMNTARSRFKGMTFSMPNEQMRSLGTLPERSAFPSFVTVTIAPVSATAKFGRHADVGL
jgi:hypothetical protein